MNILFICSRNQWRSPTAEAIFKDRQGLNVRSAGTEPSARIKLNAKTVLWADLIFVMEKRHKDRIYEKFSSELEEKQVVILNIPDEYKFMDNELMEEIVSKVEPYLI